VFRSVELREKTRRGTAHLRGRGGIVEQNRSGKGSAKEKRNFGPAKVCAPKGEKGSNRVSSSVLGRKEEPGKKTGELGKREVEIYKGRKMHNHKSSPASRRGQPSDKKNAKPGRSLTPEKSTKPAEANAKVLITKGVGALYGGFPASAAQVGNGRGRRCQKWFRTQYATQPRFTKKRTRWEKRTTPHKNGEKKRREPSTLGPRGCEASWEEVRRRKNRLAGKGTSVSIQSHRVEQWPR